MVAHEETAWPCEASELGSLQQACTLAPFSGDPAVAAVSAPGSILVNNKGFTLICISSQVLYENELSFGASEMYV